MMGHICILMEPDAKELNDSSSVHFIREIGDGSLFPFAFRSNSEGAFSFLRVCVNISLGILFSTKGEDEYDD